MTPAVEQIEALKGADRDTDVALLTTLGGYRDVFGDGVLFDRRGDGYWTTAEDDDKNRPLPSPTGSLDDALALMRYVAPGIHWGVRFDARGYFAHITWLKHAPARDASDLAGVKAVAPTPALALVCALLKALAENTTLSATAIAPMQGGDAGAAEDTTAAPDPIHKEA